MEERVIELQRVRFKVYHGGMGANPGDCLHVAKDWAEKAVASGIVEPVPTDPDQDASE